MNIHNIHMHIHEGAYLKKKKRENHLKKKRSTDPPRATIFVEFRHYRCRFSLSRFPAGSRANIVARGKQRNTFRKKYVEQTVEINERGKRN